MRIRYLNAIGPSAAILSMVVFLSPTATTAQNPTMLKTPWGEPDLQGIWTDETDTPLQRPARFANQEVFTEAQRAELVQFLDPLLSLIVQFVHVRRCSDGPSVLPVCGDRGGLICWP